MLGGRDIGLAVGVLTMGATWVGGGFINGSAQAAYSKDLGLVWTVAPFGYSLSLVIGGTFFARRMRDAQYVTMIDPFTQKFGKWGSLLVLPAAVSEIFWSASILAALGSTLHVVLHIDDTISIVLSAAIALLYTMFGGLVAVAYTDVVQILFIVVGLFLALPFALAHPAVANIYAERQADGTPAWYGRVEAHQWGEWLDAVLLCLCGGIPWQCYFQRVLSAQSGRRAQLLSYGGAAIALALTGASPPHPAHHLPLQVRPFCSARWPGPPTGPRPPTGAPSPTPSS
jgi:high affinity choline transporter 7